MQHYKSTAGKEGSQGIVKGEWVVKNEDILFGLGQKKSAMKDKPHEMYLFGIIA